MKSTSSLLVAGLLVFGLAEVQVQANRLGAADEPEGGDAKVIDELLKAGAEGKNGKDGKDGKGGGGGDDAAMLKAAEEATAAKVKGSFPGYMGTGTWDGGSLPRRSEEEKSDERVIPDGFLDIGCGSPLKPPEQRPCAASHLRLEDLVQRVQHLEFLLGEIERVATKKYIEKPGRAEEFSLQQRTDQEDFDAWAMQPEPDDAAEDVKARKREMKRAEQAAKDKEDKAFQPFGGFGDSMPMPNTPPLGMPLNLMGGTVSNPMATMQAAGGLSAMPGMPGSPPGQQSPTTLGAAGTNNLAGPQSAMQPQNSR
eukprot:TRINITY_DN81501_c0_g1_i1.p1 TRINITY_DN81501_c0_g1~~TRINITY_DN81501_c0_g1_i1.p1  ORF type:complete len:310 (-),score=108.46 TRINITY_DN81501_c0_g1_i1:153-1082(-)